MGSDAEDNDVHADPFDAASQAAVPLPEIAVPEIKDAPVAQTITVNRDNVLAAAKIIQGALDSESTVILGYLQKMRIKPAGGDPVSTECADAWNTRLLDADDSYANRVGAYLGGLRQLVQNLVDTAKRYGYGEQEIIAALQAADRPG